MYMCIIIPVAIILAVCCFLPSVTTQMRPITNGSLIR